MRYLLWFGVLLMFGSMFFGSKAKAKQHCSTFDKVHERLERQYKEFNVGVGVTTEGAVIELYRTEDGKTWTLVVTFPDGRTCLVAAGENWETVPFKGGKKV